VPVLRLGVVEAEDNAGFPAGRGQFLQRIAIEWSGVDDGVLADLGSVAAKAAFEVSKVVLDLYRRPKTDANEVHARLLELQGLILSAQAALGDAEDEIRRLKRALDGYDQMRVFSYASFIKVRIIPRFTMML
jgi:hypothetical protein